MRTSPSIITDRSAIIGFWLSTRTTTAWRLPIQTVFTTIPYRARCGKRDQFPLLGLGIQATGRNKLRRETPVILDPCNKNDCDLIAYQADGRPVLNPKHAADASATMRVEQSKILLNLDHPDFNSKREQLYHDIANDVKIYEELPAGADGRRIIRDRMKTILGPKAAFSTAARYYLQLHRHLNWVEDLLGAQ